MVLIAELCNSSVHYICVQLTHKYAMRSRGLQALMPARQLSYERSFSPFCSREYADQDPAIYSP